jgi:hypothetical protein
MLKKLPLCLNTLGAAFRLPNSGTNIEHRMTKPRYWSRETSLLFGAEETAELVTWIGDDLVVTIVIGMQTSDCDLSGSKGAVSSTKVDIERASGRESKIKVESDVVECTCATLIYTCDVNVCSQPPE